MPTWKEHIKQIQALRKQRDENDQRVYAAGIGLQKTDNKIQQIKRRDTSLPADREGIKTLKEKIDLQEAGLRELNKELSLVNSFFGVVKQQEELISFLEKKIRSLEAAIVAANAAIRDIQGTTATDRREIIIWQNKLVTYKEQLAATKNDLEAVRRQKELLTREEQSSRQRKEEMSSKKEAQQRELLALQDALKEKLNSGSTSPDEAEREKTELEREYAKAKIDLSASRIDLHNAVNAIYADPHPRAVVSSLDDAIPFLLFPVRVETRFVNQSGANELWLRIYPDDISIHTHEKLLTATELNAGEGYWIALWNAGQQAAAEKEDQQKQAWRNLVDKFGPQRSAWIAIQTKPVNWNTIPADANPEALNFSPHELSKLSAWSRAPRAYELPDKFVVMLYEGDTIVREQMGNLIPDELFMGPDPMDPDAFVKTDNLLEFSAEFDWTSNFEKAVAVGMGLKIPLTPAQASGGFDKVLVLGLTLSMDEKQGQTNLEALIDNHHYSSKGFSLLRQGSATNNTEMDGSGYTNNDPFSDTSYFVETGAPLFTAGSDCDGKNLADALGISYEPLQFIQHSDAADLKEAKAMNTALYASTLGYYFSTMLRPVLDEAKQDRLRDFYLSHVTGRGALPAIRVGNQPYGVLLTSDISKWQWARRESVADRNFLGGLQEILRIYSNRWNELLRDVMYMGKQGADPSAVLMDILGLQASSVSFHQRVGYSTDNLKNKADFIGAGKYADDVQESIQSKDNLMVFFAGLGYTIFDENDNARVPQLLRLVFQHFHTLLDAANLIDDVPLSEINPIRPFDEATPKNYIHWLYEASSIPVLERQQFGTGIDAPTSLLYLQLRRSFLLQLHDTVNRWLIKKGIDIRETTVVANFHNIRKPDLTKWELMRGKVGIAEANHPQADKSMADYMLTTGRNEDEVAFLNKMKTALNELADLPTARLERCFAEHVDTCSYRLDAWQSAFFQRRLQDQRRINNPEGQGRSMGIFFGAFSWLVDLRPSLKRRVTERSSIPGEPVTAFDPLYEYVDNGGFVHTPSLNHAMAAAVLRSGYLNHANSTEPDVMAVNLSSQRVRRAMFVLQGIRNGQSLEALLGYQFERGLHDRGSASDDLKPLNAYIYDFRIKFPISRHFVVQQGATTSTETIPATDVVNGLLLAESKEAFPYGVAGTINSATLDQQNAVKEEKDKLADTLDAIKDLLLSESVYQMVQGNFDRSGAVLNAMKDATVPPELDIITTPRSSRFSFTNKVCIHFNPLPGDSANPRAAMENGMNQWLGSVLGELALLACRVSHTDEEGGLWADDIAIDRLGLEPIDMVYISGNELNTGTGAAEGPNSTGASELEMRIAYCYRKDKGLDDTIAVRIEFLRLEVPAGRRPLGEVLPLLRKLKSLITDSRSLHAEDFVPGSTETMALASNPRGYDTDNLDQRVQQAIEVFDTYMRQLENIAITTNEAVGELEGLTKLGTMFTALETEGRTLEKLDFTLENTDAGNLIDVLILIAGYGLPDCFPQLSIAVDDNSKRRLLIQAQQVLARMRILLANASAIFSDAGSTSDTIGKTEKLIQAAKTIFGDSFNVLPVFNYSNGADIQQSSDDGDQLLTHAKVNLNMSFPADEWLQNISHVRPRLARWETIRTLSELFTGEALELKPLQLPYRANDSWVALEFPAEREAGIPFTINQDTLSITVHGESAFAAGAKQTGLLLDEMVEMIPVKDEITGIAFNYNQPNAVPPQTLLLAVPPVEKGHWDWDELVGILNDTLLRAKQRAVEPAMLDKSTRAELGVLLPAILANFSEYDLDLALDYRTNVAFFADNMPVNAVSL